MARSLPRARQRISIGRSGVHRPQMNSGPSKEQPLRVPVLATFEFQMIWFSNCDNRAYRVSTPHQPGIAVTRFRVNRQTQRPRSQVPTACPGTNHLGMRSTKGSMSDLADTESRAQRQRVAQGATFWPYAYPLITQRFLAGTYCF